MAYYTNIVVCNNRIGPTVRRQECDQQQKSDFGVVRRRVGLGRSAGHRRRPIAGAAAAATVQTGDRRCWRVGSGHGQTVALVDHRHHADLGRDQIHTEEAHVVDHGRSESCPSTDPSIAVRRSARVQRAAEENQKTSAIRHRIGDGRETRDRRPYPGIDRGRRGNARKPCRRRIVHVTSPAESDR